MHKQVNPTATQTDTAHQAGFAAVLFDLDGVIAATTDLHYRTWDTFARQHGYAPTPAELHDTNGRRAAETLRLWFGSSLDDAAIHTLSEQRETLFLQMFQAGTPQTVPGLVGFVEQLEAARIPIAVVTSAVRENAETVLNCLGLLNRLPTLVTASDVSHGKPNPEPYLKAAEVLGVQPSRCLVIEDSILGLQAGKAAGAKCLALTTSFARDALATEQPDWIADNFSTLPSELRLSCSAPAIHNDANQNHQKEIWSTRAAFFASGLSSAAWAPLVPLVKTKLELSDAHLGFLLLSPGVGLLATMPFAGALTQRFGCRRVIVVSGAIAACTLPALVSAGQPWILGVLLGLFGATAGLMDVAMNVHAVLVERRTGRTMMSGFHGLWSVGGVSGAGLVTAFLIFGFSGAVAAGVATLATLLLLFFTRPHLLTSGGTSKGPSFAFPHGIVLLLGICCFILFLAEGSVTDWAGVFLTTERGLSAAYAGLGYVAFAFAMTACRLAGDPIVRAIGPVRIVRYGTLCAAAGFLIASLVPNAIVGILGYALVGIGASNVVPVMFSAAGRQKTMPTHLAIPTMTTIGYTGHLAGPALIGFLASAVGLGWGLAAVAGLLVFVALIATRIEN